MLTMLTMVTMHGGNGDLGFHQVEEALSKSGGQHLDCWSSDIDLGVSKDIIMIMD